MIKIKSHFYNNVVHPLMYEGWHFTDMWKTIA